MQRLTLIYLYSYLIAGGVGLLVVPDLVLGLLQSNGAYGDAMPRVTGTFMVVLGGLVLQFARARDYRHYGYTVLAQSFLVIVFVAIHLRAADFLSIVLAAIVLIGLIPSIFVLVRGTTRRDAPGSA